MEEITEEAGHPVKKQNLFRKILMVLIACRNREKRDLHPAPWARIRERKGSRILVWGSGDGKTFGDVPLDSEVTFSVDANGVKLRRADGETVLIGSPENERANILLSRKIERSLRSQGNGFRAGVAGAFLLVLTLLFVVGAESGSEFWHFASLSQSLPGSGEALPDPSFSPSSMSSGLTCHTH